MKVLVKIEYKNQSWFVTQEETMGKTHEIPKNTKGRSYRVLSLVEERTDEVR